MASVRTAAGAFYGLALAAVFLGGACDRVNPPPPSELDTPSPSAGGGTTSVDTSAHAPSADQRTDAEGTAAAPGAAGAAAKVPPQLLSPEELAEGWISLFDGRSLYGWKAASQADWRVEDGAIVASSGAEGLLHTTCEFGDYALRLEFRGDPGGNSGVFLHTRPVPQDPSHDCYEVNIAGAENPFPTGSLVGRLKADPVSLDDGWQTLQISVRGGAIRAQLNDHPALDYTDPSPLGRGHIGLQWKAGKIAFRNVRLQPLGLDPLFNGRDLSGWKTYPEMASKFTVTDAGWLHVQDGRGQLETERQFADFVLQLECQTHAPQLNSGVFFRCIPGEQMNGYECQIHNGFHDGDRSRPVDCGTGGFFRRQDARWVIADDQRWFHMTLIAHGPHMAAWVDGVQVSDWTDQRPEDPNPRKGLRLAAGTLMLQGHDPTTDISFRGLRAAEMAPAAGP